MSRYIASVRKQLQDVSDLFTTRYGRDSNIAEIAVKTLVAATLLEHELQLHQNQAEESAELDAEQFAESSLIASS